MFSTPICARKQTNGPPGIDQGFSTLQRRRQLPRSGGAHVLNVKLWGCGNETILYFSVQLVEKLGGLSPPQSEKWEGLSPPCPPPPPISPPLYRQLQPPPCTIAAMHYQPEWCTHPPPPAPPFLLAQNLSSKQIAPTDNMRQI